MDEVISAAEPAIWVEILARQQDVASRQRFADTPITVGRAYDNDVVIDDPHVAAHHLRIERAEDGSLAATDLGSRNGLYLDHERTRRERVAIDGERALRIGNTWLRVRAANHAVPAEEALTKRLPYWPAALICIAGVFALEMLDLWLSETGEPKAIRYLTPVLVLLVMVGVWTTGWSVLTRVFTGHARFGLHFLIIAAGLLAYSVYDQISDMGAFALSWTSLATNAYVVAWLLLGAVCVAHLFAIGRGRRPLKIAVGVLLAAAGIAMQTLKFGEFRSTYGQPVTLRRLEPPALRLVTPQREAAFFTDAAALRAELDKARTDEPVGGEASGDDD